MGTRIELHQFGPGGPDALGEARRVIEAADDALTIHRPSPTTAVNDRLAVGSSATINDPVLLDALVGIDALWSMTGGLFDPTVDVYDGSGRWPAITIDQRAGRIETAEPAALDFGGFGKGFALDRACEALRAAGVASAFLSAGESSIAVIGQHPVGGAWPVAIPHPLAPDRQLVMLELENEALSISSTAGAAAAAPGRSPMVRPTDGTIVTTPATAIAIEATGAAAEAMSTALLVGDEGATSRLLAIRPERRFRFTFAEGLSRSPPSPGSL